MDFWSTKMPLIQRENFVTPYLVYDAPVDEKTKKIREMFKIDESGYPEHYKWRDISRLGPVYNPADPFRKFDEYDPKTSISTHVAMFIIGATISGAITSCVNVVSGKPWWARGWVPVLGAIGFTGVEMFIHKQALRRQALRNAITVDYVTKHPDRFPPIKRPKMREILYVYSPVR